MTVCSRSPASFICRGSGSGQNAISCEGEVGGGDGEGGGGGGRSGGGEVLQATSKASKSYQELELCQRCVPTRQPLAQVCGAPGRQL